MLNAFRILIFSFCLIAAGIIATAVILHDSFHSDYQIDLIGDDYIIKDNQGKIHHVKKGHLEEWFLQDNL
jgi:hypothetical protein